MDRTDHLVEINFTLTWFHQNVHGQILETLLLNIDGKKYLNQLLKEQTGNVNVVDHLKICKLMKDGFMIKQENYKY